MGFEPMEVLPSIPLRGILSLFLGRPRLTRIGTWLAKDYSGIYQEGVSVETP